MEITGGGGTDFTTVLKTCRQSPPQALIILTNGHAIATEYAPGYTVLSALTEDGQHPVKLGETINWGSRLIRNETRSPAYPPHPTAKPALPPGAIGGITTKQESVCLIQKQHRAGALGLGKHTGDIFLGLTDKTGLQVATADQVKRAVQAFCEFAGVGRFARTRRTIQAQARGLATVKHALYIAQVGADAQATNSLPHADYSPRPVSSRAFSPAQSPSPR